MARVAGKVVFLEVRPITSCLISLGFFLTILKYFFQMKDKHLLDFQVMMNPYAKALT